ncbi:unnamed protein product [Lasius platythorax]|uniref:Uncharacterized protein n=1 Tax=Lasius platythorax TaxID=488582 RepID=A0AAV2NM58_9HYME
MASGTPPSNGSGIPGAASSCGVTHLSVEVKLRGLYPCDGPLSPEGGSGASCIILKFRLPHVPEFCRRSLHCGFELVILISERPYLPPQRVKLILKQKRIPSGPWW